MSSNQVILIGSGLGGLSAAISLKQSGYDVEVFEKNAQIGGKLNVLKERIVAKLERMGLNDLRKHVVFEHFWTPLDIRAQYNSNRGSIYGVAPCATAGKTSRSKRPSSALSTRTFSSSAAR